jgi:hypothetical protein
MVLTAWESCSNSHLNLLPYFSHFPVIWSLADSTVSTAAFHQGTYTLCLLPAPEASACLFTQFISVTGNFPTCPYSKREQAGFPNVKMGFWPDCTDCQASQGL